MTRSCTNDCDAEDVGFLKCIHCEYDLRGCPLPRCPECGNGFLVSDVVRHNKNKQARNRGFEVASAVLILWPIAYFCERAVFSTQYLSDEIDNVANLWVKMTVFNIPLHVMLLACGYYFSRSTRKFEQGMGHWSVVILSILITAHVLAVVF
jgi:hypothetical protein